jgi:hypothetical protein
MYFWFVRNKTQSMFVHKKKQTLTEFINSAIGLTWDRLEKSLYEVRWEEAELWLKFWLMFWLWAWEVLKSRQQFKKHGQKTITSDCEIISYSNTLLWNHNAKLLSLKLLNNRMMYVDEQPRYWPIVTSIWVVIDYKMEAEKTR